MGIIDGSIPGFMDDLRGALGALRRYDDGRNFPIPAYWEEETRRFGGTAQQRPPNRYQPTPVFSRGLATIAEKSLLRVQRYFSRRIHSAARDCLIQRVHDLKESEQEEKLPATGEPAWRAYNRLTQLQGPLSGSFLKALPEKHRSFLADEWTALSCFRFGIPLPHLSQGVGNDMWGDKVLVRHSSMHTYHHDQMRDEIAKACRGIRRFSGHTELRVGPHLYADLTVFAGLGDATLANPLDLDVHIHHLYGQSQRSRSHLQHLDNAKVAKYGPTCSSQGREVPAPRLHRLGRDGLWHPQVLGDGSQCGPRAWLRR